MFYTTGKGCRGVYMHFTKEPGGKAKNHFGKRKIFSASRIMLVAEQWATCRETTQARRARWISHCNDRFRLTSSAREPAHDNKKKQKKQTQHQTHYTFSSSDTMRLMETSNAGSQQSSCRTWYTSPGSVHVWTHPWPDLILSHQSPLGSRRWKCSLWLSGERQKFFRQFDRRSFWVFFFGADGPRLFLTGLGCVRQSGLYSIAQIVRSL